MVISRKTHGSQNGSFYNTNQIFNGIPNISDTIKNGQMSKEITKEHVDMTPSVYKYNDELPATGKLRRGAASDPFKLTGRNHSLGPKDKNAHVNKCNTTLEENRENVSIMSNRKVGEYQFAEGLGHISKSIKKEIVEKMTPNMYKDEFPTTGEASEKFKSKLQDTAPFVYKDDLLLATGSSKVIKREPDQSLQPFNEDNESHSQTAATVSCVVPTDNDTFLELPAPLPLSNKRGIKMKRLVVYLRDRLVNLWPVFYHEHSNFYALTEGWSEYRKANNIQPGDLCIFGAENKSNRVMAVNIVHKWS